MNRNFSNELQQLQMELRAQNFDIIRFSTYRTACKLRFIQKKFNFHLLDLLNVVESLRESLTTLSSEPNSKNVTPIKTRTSTLTHSSLPNNSQFLTITHLTTFLTSIYTNLNKRLPFSQQILHIDNCIHSAIAWFLYVYNANNSLLRFNSFRVVLILLCNGKLNDKVRHLFTSCLSTSSSSTLTYGQIDELLHEILALPYALQEIPYSAYRKDYAHSIFSHLSTPITLTNFLDILIYNNTTPNCLQWFIIFHRLISVENVIHRTTCSACQRPSFSGFRYKCQQCHNRAYQLCQNCFWRGRTSDQHLSTHEMKEYTYFIPPNKDFGHSIRKSFPCVPKNEKRNQLISPLTVDKEQELSPHFIPTDLSKPNKNNEHINAEKQKSNIRSSSNQHRSQREYNDHRNAEKKLIISKLEADNRRIHHEINTLRRQLKHRSLDHIDTNDYHEYNDRESFSTIEQHYAQTLPTRHGFSSYAFNQRRAGSVERTNRIPYFENELQTLLSRKHQLEQNREDLTSQLNPLGRIVHYSPQLQQRSTTSSSSRMKSHTLNLKNSSNRSHSTPASPIHNLFLAADSLTSAMSSLIQQLNTDDTESYLTVLKTGNNFKYYPYDSGSRTDEESFITSDDDDGGTFEQ